MDTLRRIIKINLYKRLFNVIRKLFAGKLDCLSHHQEIQMKQYLIAIGAFLIVFPIYGQMNSPGFMTNESQIHSDSNNSPSTVRTEYEKEEIHSTPQEKSSSRERTSTETTSEESSPQEGTGAIPGATDTEFGTGTGLKEEPLADPNYDVYDKEEE